MVQEEGQNLDRVINKIVWGILLDILTALF